MFCSNHTNNEEKFIFFLQSIHTGWLDSISSIISNYYTTPIFWTVILSLLVILNKIDLKKTAITVAFGVALYYIMIPPFVQKIFFRMRPYYVLQGLKIIGDSIDIGSFPSGHVTITALMAFITSYYYPRFTVAGIIIVIIMALSRIYNGFHWPVDTIAGAFTGIILGYFSVLIADKLMKNKITDRHK